MSGPTVVDLFAGGAGAATGLHHAGFNHLACIEWDREACGVARRLGFPVVRADVATCPVGARPDLVWASPPCQSHSTAGKRLAGNDERDGFAAMYQALDRLRPTWLLVEQVPGLLAHKADACGDPVACSGCMFERTILPALRDRFEHVAHRVLNAASFGAPQARRRLIIACGPKRFRWPDSTHSLAALARAKADGSYWRRHGIAPLPMTDREREALDRDALGLDDCAPWRTVRDALGEGLTQVRKESRGDRPDREPDEPSFTITGRVFDDLHVVGAGTNPHGPDAAHERTERDLTDEVAPVVAAEQIGNAGPWVLDTGSNGKPGREAPRTLDQKAATVSGCGNAMLYRAVTVDDPSATILGSSRDAGRRADEQARGLLAALDSDRIHPHATEKDRNPQGVRSVRRSDDAEAMEQRGIGGDDPLRPPPLLRPDVLLAPADGVGPGENSDRELVDGAQAGASDPGRGSVRDVRTGGSRNASPQREHQRQPDGEPRETVPGMPHQGPPIADVLDPGMRGEPPGTRFLRQASPAVEKMGRPARGKGESAPAAFRRRLTPAETALLQGWPEVIPALAGCRTKTAAYRIVGNAVPPPVSEALGRALLETMR